MGMNVPVTTSHASFIGTSRPRRPPASRPVAMGSTPDSCSCAFHGCRTGASVGEFKKTLPVPANRLIIRSVRSCR